MVNGNLSRETIKAWQSRVIAVDSSTPATATGLSCALYCLSVARLSLPLNAASEKWHLNSKDVFEVIIDVFTIRQNIEIYLLIFNHLETSHL